MGIRPYIASFAIVFLIISTGVRAESPSTPQNTDPAPQTWRQRLMRWIQPQWVDLSTRAFDGSKKPGDGNANGDDGSNDSSANNSKNGNRNNSALGSGATLGSLSGAQGGNDGSNKSGNGDGNADDSDRGGQPPAMGGGGGGGSIAFPKWWPACVFIDPKYGNGNDIIKGAVEIAAKCQVNLVVIPITVLPGSYGPSEKDINAKQKASCNIGSTFGVPNWSTSTINQFPDPPAEMCDVPLDKSKGGPPWDTGVAGCAQLASGSKAAGDGQSGGVGTGGATPSIENAGGANSGVLMHEMIGHSEMGMPNYEEGKKPPMTDLGLGIGKENGSAKLDLDKIINSLYAAAGISRIPQTEIPEVGAVEGQDLKGEGFNGIGCGIFFANAYKNDGRWRYDPKQTTYYVKEENPERQWPLGKPLFGPPGPAPQTGSPQVVGDPRGSEELTVDDSTPKGASSTDQGLSAVAPPGDTADPRHKMRPGDTNSTDSLVANLKKAIASPDDPSQVPNYPPDKPGVEKSARLVFDDTVKKGAVNLGDNGGNDTQTSQNYSPGSMGSQGNDQPDTSGASGGSPSGNGGGDRLVFDDNAKKGDGTDGSDGASRDPSSILDGGAGFGTSAGSAGFGGGSGGMAGGMDGGGFSSGVGAPSKANLSNSMDSDFFDGRPRPKPESRKRVKGSTLRKNESAEVVDDSREISAGH